MKKLVSTLMLGLIFSSVAFTQSDLSLISYQDMSCEQLIESQTDDAFILFAREEITTMVEGNYCELRALGSAEKNFDGPEFTRTGINDAAHSKLIEALYMDFLSQ